MEDKKEIVICLGSSCFARGNNKNLEFIQEYLKVNNLKDYFQGTVVFATMQQGSCCHNRRRNVYRREQNKTHGDIEQ